MKNSIQSGSEFFRHLRPLWYDKSRGIKVPHQLGGISFLLKPTKSGEYDYWVYICPQDAPFSVKHAISKLRQAANNAKPWGSIKMRADIPVLELLIDDAIHTPLPSEISRIIKDIKKQIISAEAQEADARKYQMRKIYEKC